MDGRSCAACGALLHEGARFCARCGTPVSAACGACGTPLPVDAGFCPACGRAVARGATSPAVAATSATPGGRERKTATILFADIVGFTGLNEAHDPELVQGWVGRAFDRLSDEVHRYEGTTEKFAGDAVLAIFGVPQVHEDDAERAVRAALEMQSVIQRLAAEARDTGRPAIALRIGIETGEILVDQDHVAGDRQRMVTGDPVNTAARLQQLAAPGDTVVGPGTYAATRDLVDYEELTPAVVKGKSAPVAYWRAGHVKARRGGLRSPLGFEAPLVGRDDELTLVKEHVRRMTSERRPHLVTVIGAPGVGKSRLTWELEKYLDGLPEGYVWRKGRCLAYAQAPYGAIADIVRADLGVTDDVEADAVAARLAERGRELALDLDDAGLGAVSALLGLREASAVPRPTLFEAWRRYVESLSRLAPAVLVLEDIHWADEGTLDWIEHICRWADGPLLLVCLARHELLERRPGWGGGIHNTTSIVLEPLRAEESALLVEGLLPGGIPEDVSARIVGLTEGNPLFTEELVRMFVDRGVVRFADGRWQLASAVEELEVPKTVHAVLAARLDALPRHEKALAQDAAVVGRIFWDAVLAYLGGDKPARIDELLRRLRVKELVVPREPSSLSGTSEFGFRHVLIRDVAYDSLPKRDRAVKHRSVAEWAERELGDTGEDAAELLASHYLSALRYEEEFSDDPRSLAELRTRTYRFARAAAERADRMHELETGSRWMSVAVELARKLERPPEERATVAAEALERGAGWLPTDEIVSIGEDALAVVDGMAPFSQEVLEVDARIRATLGYAYHNRGENPKAQALLHEGLRRAGDGPPTAGRAMLLTRLGWALWRTGAADEAAGFLERAVDEARAVGARDTEAWAIHDLGIAYEQGSRRGQGVELVRRSLELAREVGDMGLVMRCYINLPALLMGDGAPWQEIMPVIEEGLAFARRAADRSSEGWVAFQMTQLLEDLGRFDEEEHYARESLEAARAVGEPQNIQGRLAAMAWSDALRGRWDEARRRRSEAEAIDATEEGQNRVYESIWQAWSLWMSDPHTATRLLAEALPRISVDSEQGGLWLARMAVRTRDTDAIAVARACIPSEPLPQEGPIRRLQRRHADLLCTEPDEAGPLLVDVATELERLGYVYHAIHAFVDAALLLARAGASDASGQAAARADELAARIGLVHELGPLPESRWIGRSAAVVG